MFVVRIPRVGCRVGREGDNWQGHAGRGRGRGGGGWEEVGGVWGLGGIQYSLSLHTVLRTLYYRFS